MQQVIVDCTRGTSAVVTLSPAEQATFLAQQQSAAQQSAAQQSAAQQAQAQAQPAPHTVRYASASTTIGPTDYMVIMAAVGQTVLLPSAVGLMGARYIVKNAAIKNTTVSAPAGQTIDGKATYIVGSEYAWVGLTSDGSGWLTC